MIGWFLYFLITSQAYEVHLLSILSGHQHCMSW